MFSLRELRRGDKLQTTGIFDGTAIQWDTAAAVVVEAAISVGDPVSFSGSGGSRVHGTVEYVSTDRCTTWLTIKAASGSAPFVLLASTAVRLERGLPARPQADVLA